MFIFAAPSDIEWINTALREFNPFILFILIGNILFKVGQFCM